MTDRFTSSFPKALISIAALMAAAGCAKGDNPSAGDNAESANAQSTQSPEQAQGTPNSYAESLDAVLADARRSDAERARDAFRNPKQTLLFFGVEPSMTVLEAWPGGGWYTNVLAPYLAAGNGTYYAANFAAGDSEYRQKAIANFTAKYSDPAQYGAINMTTLQAHSDEEEAKAPIAPAGSVDVVLTFRNTHNWVHGGVAADYFAQFYTALKPGGVLGLVAHRADPESESADTDHEDQSATGYISEAEVIALAQEAGFVLDERSEINANPADTKDHPFGVWTLPPVRRSAPAAGVEPAEDFDRAKYDAIGESDRMTLRFRKPASE